MDFREADPQKFHIRDIGEMRGRRKRTGPVMPVLDG